MIGNKTIAVVIPAYNEGNLIDKTLLTMPDYVDSMIVVEDASTDDTYNRISEIAKNDERITIVKHEVNKGLGQGLIDGYLKSIELKNDVTAVMAGDAQMDPDDLINVITPIVDEECDYVKGHRLLYKNVSNIMPKHRFFGNSVLSLLTKFATGYWHLIDPQCGYTAISLEAISDIPIEEMTKGYGYNADILNMLNRYDYQVMDVSVRPVYGEEKSKIKLLKYMFKVSWLLLRLFSKRLVQKYVIRDFNPLVMFYILGVFSLFAISIPMFIRFFIIYFAIGELAKTTALICAMSFFWGTQSIFFAMWMDMTDNKKLSVYGNRRGRKRK